MLLTETLGDGDAAITIGDGCWIAAETVVLPGATVQSGSVVGARSQVRGTVPTNVVAVGLPAVVIGMRVGRG